ncbi:MAG: trypsin-like peptidase domain-containing protein [Bauldia sp.]
MRLALALLALCLPTLVSAPPAAANAKLEVRSCSAALFRMEGMTLDQKALVLTAGHCINAGRFKNDLGTFPADGERFIDRPEDAFIQVKSEAGAFKRYHTRRLVFATMTVSDLAVYELDASYADILAADKDVEVFILGTRPMVAGVAFGVPSANKQRSFDCVSEAIVPTLLDKPWRWNEVIRFRHQESCLFVGGASGSPVLYRDRIVAVANDVFDPGTACAFGSPCEVDTDGKTTTAKPGQSYATQTYRLYDCYDAMKKAFDFTRASCTLAGERHSGR